MVTADSLMAITVTAKKKKKKRIIWMQSSKKMQTVREKCMKPFESCLNAIAKRWKKGSELSYLTFEDIRSTTVDLYFA